MPCQVTYFLNDDWVGDGTCTHLNEHGMLVRCDKPVSLNKRLKLVLQFPGGRQSVEVQGIVVWANIHGPADAFTPRGMGVKFVNLDRKAERFLVQAASRYEAQSNIYKCYYN